MMSSCPLMVYVLPEPVWPYAKMVAWYPAMAAFSSCVIPQIFNTSDCLELGAKQPWNVKLRVMTEPLGPGTMTCNANRTSARGYGTALGLVARQGMDGKLCSMIGP